MSIANINNFQTAIREHEEILNKNIDTYMYDFKYEALFLSSKFKQLILPKTNLQLIYKNGHL